MDNEEPEIVFSEETKLLYAKCKECGAHIMYSVLGWVHVTSYLDWEHPAEKERDD